jgi:TMPIT-like protein
MDDCERAVRSLERRAGEIAAEQRRLYADLDTAIAELQAIRKNATKANVEHKKKGKEEKKEEKGEWRRRVRSLDARLERLDGFMVPKEGGWFTRLFLGSVNVKSSRDGERVKLKQGWANPVFFFWVCFLCV